MNPIQVKACCEYFSINVSRKDQEYCCPIHNTNHRDQCSEVFILTWCCLFSSVTGLLDKEQLISFSELMNTICKLPTVKTLTNEKFMWGVANICKNPKYVKCFLNKIQTYEPQDNWDETLEFLLGSIHLIDSLRSKPKLT